MYSNGSGILLAPPPPGSYVYGVWYMLHRLIFYIIACHNVVEWFPIISIESDAHLALSVRHPHRNLLINVQQ